MNYPYSYFEDEVKDGFFVPSIIKRCWAFSLSVYRALDDFCIKNGIRLGVAYGTMLGAVRHGGFIPWDDDFDTAILRKDYKKLYEMTMNNPEWNYVLMDDVYNGNLVNPNMVRRFAKYNEYFISYDKWKECYGFPFALCVDLFIFDYIPFDKDEREFCKAILDIYSGVIAYIQEMQYEDDEAMLQDTTLQYRLGKLEEFTGNKFTDDSPVLSQLYRQRDEFCERYTERDSRARKMLWQGSDLGFENWAFDDYIEMPFENDVVRIPIGYDHILRRMFSDYMHPVRLWDSHNYPVFNELEEKLWREHGLRILRYPYDKEEIQKNRSRNKGKISLMEEMRASLDLLSEAHSFIRDSSGSKEMIPDVLDMLGQCQTLAISMGEQIENRAVYFESIIHVLEEYCDYIYYTYQRYQTEGYFENFMEKVAMYEQMILEKITNGLTEKREVVFLVYKVEHWKSLHALWKRESEKKDTEVTVIPVPWYYRNFENELEKEMNLECDGFPAEIELTSYQEYNFEVHHPDTIVYQFPYDEYSYALSLHPFFYVSNLRQYTEHMVFVPPYRMVDVPDENERAKYTLRWYLQTPGLMYADKIFAQSEQMKKIYIEILDEFTGHDQEQKWDEKITCEGFPLDEWESNKRLLIQNEETGELFTKDGKVTERTIYDEILLVPHLWMSKVFKGDGFRRKVILYYVSGSVLLEYKEKMIDKVRQVMSVAENAQKDIVFLWYKDPYAEQILKHRVPAVWKSYCRLLQTFQENQIGILTDTKDVCFLAKFCDAFYGDGGIVMNECRKLGKPILWENPDVEIE